MIKQAAQVFFPRKSHGQRNLVGYSPGARKSQDMTEQLTLFTFSLLVDTAWQLLTLSGCFIHCVDQFAECFKLVCQQIWFYTMESVLFKKDEFQCRNKWGPSKWEQAKSIYPELAIAKESATIIYVWERLQGRQETGNALQREKKKKKRRFSVWRLLAWGSGGRLTRSNHPCDCLLACSVSQSYPTLCDPTDCNLPDSSVHGVLQVRILKWVSISSSRRFSQPRDRTPVSCTGR